MVGKSESYAKLNSKLRLKLKLKLELSLAFSIRFGPNLKLKFWPKPKLNNMGSSKTKKVKAEAED